MKWFGVALFAVALAAAVGCSGIPGQEEPGRGLDEPIKVGLGAEVATDTPIRMRSGQMIRPPRCCPPLQLRDASGTVVQELPVGGPPQRIEAPPGRYLLVGHDPTGDEHSVAIEIVGE